MRHTALEACELTAICYNGKGVKEMQRERTARKDRELVIERLMAEYGGSVARVCVLFLRDRQLAQDAAQETFVKAWKAIDSLREGGSEKAWLMQIAVNTCRSMLRSRYFRMVDRSVSIDDLPEPAHMDETGDDSLLREVMALPDKYREAIVLHYYQELTAEETAKALNVPAATVRTRLARARKMLKSRVEGWYFGNE